MFHDIELSGRTLRVLEEDYAYTPSSPPAYLSLFHNALRAVAEHEGNEHDAAAMFMASLCEMICHSTRLDPATRRFVRRNVNMMLASLDQMSAAKVRALVHDLDRLATCRGA